MSRLLESYNRFLGGPKSTIREQILEYTSPRPVRTHIPPVPQDVKRHYASLPPRERREIEDDVEEAWGWLHTGVIALTTLASAGAIYLAISHELKKIKTSGEQIKSEIDGLENKKDEKIDKSRLRKIMGHAHAINAAIHRATTLANRLENEDQREKARIKIGNIKDFVDDLNREIKNYTLVQSEQSLSKAESTIDEVLKMADVSEDDFKVISEAFKQMYHDVKKEVKKHEAMAKEIQAASKKIKIPGTSSDVIRGDEDTTAKDLARQISTKLTLDNEQFALLNAADQARMQKDWYDHMNRGRELMAMLQGEGPSRPLLDIFREGGQTAKMIAHYSTVDKEQDQKRVALLKESAEKHLHNQIWGRRASRGIPGQMTEFL